MTGSIDESQDLNLEKEIEHEILHYLNRQPGVWAFKVNTLGVFDKEKNVFRRSNSPFQLKGVSDIIGSIDGYFLAIEVKRSEKAKRSKEQEAFVNKINQLGGFACFAWSLSQVEALLQEARAKIKALKTGTHGETRD